MIIHAFLLVLYVDNTSDLWGITGRLLSAEQSLVFSSMHDNIITLIAHVKLLMLFEQSYLRHHYYQ